MPSQDAKVTERSFLEGVTLEINKPGLKDLKAVAFTCDEGISRPYRIEIEVRTPDGTPVVTMSDILNQTATVVLAHGSRDFCFNGIVASIEHLGCSPLLAHHYRLTIVPPVWLLSRNRRCRVFTQLSVPGLIQQILNAGKVKFDVKLESASSYPTCPHLMQYEESDLAFISRLMEQEGIFYYFSCDDNGVPTMVIGDSVSAHLNSKVTMPTDTMRVSSPGILGPVFFQGIPAASATVMDYDPAHPANAYSETAQLSGSLANVAVGALQQYEGPQSQTQADVQRYAKLYLQEVSCRQSIGAGASGSFRLRSGYLFALTEHPVDAFNTTYLLESVKHEVLPEGYHNSFTIIPQSQLPYRPMRSTPVPRIPGYLLGKVTATAGNQSQEIDGAYKVKLLLEETQLERVMRMAQPYAGPNQGVHFPLPPDTEVLLMHINGDPNRPVIAAALPNIDNPSPVKEANKQQGVVRSAKGAMLVFDDGDNTQQVSLTTGTGHTMVFNDLKDSPQMSLTTKGAHTLMLDDTTESPKISLKSNGGHELKMEDVESAPKASFSSNGGHKFVMDDTAEAPKASLATTGGHSLVLDDTKEAPTVTLSSTGGHTLTLDDSESGPKHSLASGGGHKVVLDDTAGKGQVAFSSTGGQSLKLDDTSGNAGVSMASAGGQKIMLGDSPAAITVDSSGDVTIKATGNLVLKAGAATITLKASGDITVEGANITLTAQMAAAVKGTATAELSASGQTTVKGGIVMIN